jgi:Fe-S cluster assembly scaffold protein SufB
MAGVDVSETHRAGRFMHMDHSGVLCRSEHEGLEILDIKDALKKYDGLPEHFWKKVSPDKDAYTRAAFENLHGGYFVKVAAGAKIPDPVQSCMFIKGQKVGQNVHNVVIVGEGAELHMMTGCAVSGETQSGAHLGITEFYLEKNARLTFTMIHNWGENMEVRPRTAGVAGAGAVFQSNYILLKAVKDLQSYPSMDLDGEGAVARFNSVIVAPKGSYVNSGSRINLNAPGTRGEIVSRTITTGGTIIAPGYIEANAVPARGHLECKGLILGQGVIHAVPELRGTVEGVELSHEAAVGKIAQAEIEYLMARGMDEDEATSTIVRGFLNVDIMGLPAALKKVIDETIAETEKDMF